MEMNHHMSNFTATDIKQLRDSTGAGMMDAKKALTEADGDFDAALEVLRVKGAAKAAKRGAERTADNGLVASAGNAMVSVHCETDFVAKNADFQQLAADLAAVATATKPADLEELAAQRLPDGRTVTEAVEQAAAVIGEKIALGKVAVFEGNTTSYLHKRASDLPAQVGVLLEYSGDDEAAARAAAMQVAAMRPQYLTREDVPADVLDNERRIAEATAREEGKPEQALPKIIEGRVNGYFKDTVLLDQPSVQASKQSVGDVLAQSGVTVTRFERFEVGV